jgi:hypothetical protein
LRRRRHELTLHLANHFHAAIIAHVRGEPFLSEQDPPGALRPVPAGGWRAELKRWALALMLALPVVLPYLSHYHYARSHGLIPTGFLILDMPYYMANARAHFAGGHFHLLYGLAFSPNENTPNIYFQPHTLLLGLLWRFSGLEINTVFLIFSAVATLVCARVALALYEQLVGFDTRGARIALLLFFWGSGLVVITGAAWLWIVGPGPLPMSFERIFDFDPFRGWWFLDFGRNLLLGTEAFYHALFFGAVLLVIRRRWIASAIVTFVLSLSHPFTGLELLGALVAWIALERILLRRKTVPNTYVVAVAAILAFHLGYYLWFLPHASPEHRSVEEAWHAAFVLTWGRLLASIALVLPLAAYTVHSDSRWKHYFAQAPARLLAMWFLVALGLSNHDLFIAPVQPLHFTRGYIWTPLFFIGAPTLVALLDYLLKKQWAGRIAIAGIIALFLCDNALWLTTIEKRPDVVTDGIMPTPQRWDVIEELRKPQYAGSLVLSQDLELGYILTAYTPLRSWYSHGANTPYREDRIAELKALFNSGTYLDEWRRRRVVIILRKDYLPAPPAWLTPLGATLAHENDAFRIYRIDPTPRAEGRASPAS